LKSDIQKVHFSEECQKMKIAVITAMNEEFHAVTACFGCAGVTRAGALKSVSYLVAGHEFIVVESGMGFDNVASAVEALIRSDRPDLLISAGFCGGLAPELRAGDVVVAQQIVIADGECFEEVPVLLSAIGQTFVARQAAEGKRVVGGVFVSTRAITAKQSLVAKLPGHYPNPVVEMESGAIAIIAAENNIPLLAIRAVSDSAAEELGFSLDEFCDPDLRCIRPYKVLLTLLRKPWMLPQLVRLAISSRRAADGLKPALTHLFPLF
jgi:adenosylhomocysteine nucleosidase